MTRSATMPKPPMITPDLDHLRLEGDPTDFVRKAHRPAILDPAEDPRQGGMVRKVQEFFRHLPLGSDGHTLKDEQSLRRESDARSVRADE